MWGTSLNELGKVITFSSHYKGIPPPKNSSIKKHSIKCQFWSDFKKIYIFEMKMKNWIEWTNKISKIWEKIRTRMYFKFLHIVSRLWEDCERQSRGKSKWSRKTSHNVAGMWRLCELKWRRLLLLTKWKEKSKICSSNFFSNFWHFICPYNPIFHFHFKNIIFFVIGPKLIFLAIVL